MEAALDLLTRVLPFEVLYTEANYRYLQWGPAGLRVLEEPGRAGPGPGSPHGHHARMTVYIDVDDVDEVYQALHERLATLPNADRRPPRDQTWKQREIHVRLPDGDWLAIGAPVRPAGDV
jgi:hypothetical protein